jgi:hypothetical protein
MQNQWEEQFKLKHDKGTEHDKTETEDIDVCSHSIKLNTSNKTFRWDIPTVLIGSQVSINAVKHDY